MDLSNINSENISVLIKPEGDFLERGIKNGTLEHLIKVVNFDSNSFRAGELIFCFSRC